MTCQDNEILLNGVLIQMARSFLQYVSESSPWVANNAATDESQVIVLAARQRQDVTEIAALLEQREHFIDFGTFPTEYTDQQFLSLQSVMGGLKRSHESVCNRISNSVVSLRTAGDAEAADLLSTITGIAFRRSLVPI
jgi:transcriptional regulatory protein LevR